MNWEKKFTKFIGSRESVIIHTVFFIVMLGLPLIGVHVDIVLLVLTTVVSLEAIYLAIFIQMTVNENTESLHEVEEDIDEIQENVGEIQEDMDEISIDIDEIESDIEEMQGEEEEGDEETHELDHIKIMLTKILEEVDRLKTIHNQNNHK
jgi:peptidoglycan hydrolase CwlO-like protein